MTGSDPRRTVRYRELFKDAEFAGMYVADVLTMTGTYLARLAVAALVYGNTGSVGLTGAVFAVSFAPHLVGPWMATLADRFPRKGLLVLSDLVRAAIVLLLIIPDIPLALILTVVFTLELVQIPFGSARLATLADVLDEERFPVGNALVAATRQALQVGGFMIGGAVVAATSPQTALVIDSLTYLFSSFLIFAFVKRRSVAWHDEDEGEAPRIWSGTRKGLSFVWRTPRLVPWFWLLALGPGLVVIVEGLAVPYADQLGGGTRLAGVIMAAPPLGTVVAFAVFGRLPIDLQNRLIYPIAFAAGITVGLAGLLGEATGSPLPVLVVLVISGATLCYMVAIQAQVAARTPRGVRGRVFGLGNTVMQLAQGTAVVSAGAIAESLPIGEVLIILGVAGVGAMGIVAWRDRVRLRAADVSPP